MIYELSYGVRLPNPTFCPQSIQNLIKTCFYEAPEKRPTFNQIKVALKMAFNKIMNDASSNSKTNEETKDPYIYHLAMDKDNNKMKSRYKLIQKGNIEESRNANAEVLVDNVQNELPTKYACIQDTENCDSNLHVYKLEDIGENSHDIGSTSELKMPKSDNVKGFVNCISYPNFSQFRDNQGAANIRSFPYLPNWADAAAAQPFVSHQNLRKSRNTNDSANCEVFQNLIKPRDTKHATDAQSYPNLFNPRVDKRAASIRSNQSLNISQSTKIQININKANFFQILKYENCYKF